MPPKLQKFTVSESLMLDLVRVLASVVVAYGHLSQSYFGTGWQDQTGMARKSVSVFFVLSGFVIRYVTSRRPGTMRQYMVDRASRIYSVAAPALLITLVADTMARHCNPAFYARWAALSLHPFVSIFANLIFCGQIWAHPIAPLSNLPFWSVNYEVAYYLMYGCFFYVAGARRWLLLAAVCLFFGPRVLYLAPLWIAGCLLHDLYQRWNARGVTALRLTGFSVLMAMVWWGLTALSRSQSEVFLRAPLSKMIAMMNNVGVRPDDYIFGFAWMAIFLWLLFLARQVTLRADTTGIRVTQFIAEGTFPIYLLHFPLFIVVAACVPYNHAALAPNLAIFFGVLVLGVLAGHPGNLLKMRMRKLLSAGE